MTEGEEGLIKRMYAYPLFTCCLSQAESTDQGKTISFARSVDIPRSIYNFRFFATAILHVVNESTYLDDKK